MRLLNIDIKVVEEKDHIVRLAAKVVAR